MNRDDAHKVLHCAMSIGELLLTNGAEVGRVEDTIRRICMAYGASRVDVFSITSCIVATMFGEGFESCTQTRRVPTMKNDFYKLDELNQLSRWICETRPGPEKIPARIDKIRRGKTYGFWKQLLIYALVSGSFTVFFGGNLRDMFASAVIGVILKCIEAFILKMSFNSLLSSLLCSTAGGFLSHLFVAGGFGMHTDLISIGNIMLFIPGVMFTNSLRDMFSGDTITGLIRCAESLLIAGIVALGFTVASFVF
ncbi:MAG: threonine/serine exporter family protein [Clostridia bacterium]|nr:threonine/serine exporter family protein [Clostridia bacterium]